MTVRGLTADQSERLSLPKGKGVIVQDVRPGSFGDTVGLDRGMVILEMNRQPVSDEDSFRKIESRSRVVKMWSSW